MQGRKGAFPNLSAADRKGIAAAVKGQGSCLQGLHHPLARGRCSWGDWQHLCHGDVKSRFRASVSTASFSRIKGEAVFLKGRKLLPKLKFGMEMGVSTLH